MYINPVLVGIFGTLIVEAIFIIALAWWEGKENDKGSDNLN